MKAPSPFVNGAVVEGTGGVWQRRSGVILTGVFVFDGRIEKRGRKQGLVGWQYDE